MRTFTTIFTLLLSIVFQSSAQIVINELQSANTNTIADEDGEYSDWIELYNSGNSSVNLKNYGLSDNPSNPLKWKFPAVIMNPGEYLIVFTSGKDRKTIVNHYETAIYYNNIWKYFVGTSEPLSTWKTTVFNDGAWNSGAGGIGYGDGDDNTVIGNTISLYLRKTFNIIDTTHIAEAVFHMDFDDGFVAYINGVEIARNNVTGNPPSYLQGAASSREALAYQGGLPLSFVIDKQLLSSALVPGNNILAIQVHNTDFFSSDLSSIPFLSFGLDNNSTLLFGTPLPWMNLTEKHNHTNFSLGIEGETIVLSDPLGNIISQKTFGYTAPDQSLARNPDGSSTWCISTSPSPGATNNAFVCNNAYISEPSYSMAPGFYPASINVSISCTTPTAQIHYTLNGKLPTITDPLYINPLTIDTTTVLRSKAFNVSGYLPSEVNTATYFIDETANLPVLSISTDSSNLWDWNNGIYVLGPNADPNPPHFNANFWQDWQKESHVEYFKPMNSRQFELDALLSINGGWSRDFAQKSFQLEAKSFYNPTEINFQLFENKPIFSYTSFNLRNSGNDWLNTMFRDDLMQTSVANTHVDYTEYQPVLVFLNTQYWGLYNMRERSNKDYMAANHGENPDSLDVIHNIGEVQQGTGTDYWNMCNYIINNDISQQSNYDSVKNILDIENYVDYMSTEIYYNNGDWLGDWTNNIKLWKSQHKNAKWRYLLVDMDFGLGLYGSSFSDNRLLMAVYPSSSNIYSSMFANILQNQVFDNYFINRFADLINTKFHPNNLLKQIQSFRDRIAPEMPRELLKYTGNPDLSDWYYNRIGLISDFVQNRPNFARSHIQSFFNLVKQVNVTLDVFPAGAGVIKISTIIPDSLPWSGIYFDGNPVKITAIPNPGYTFSYWEPNTFFPTQNFNNSVTLNISNDDLFRAHFTGASELPNIAISEINYNSDTTRDSGDWIELHNYSNTIRDISEWKLSDSLMYHNYFFPMGTALTPNQYIILAEDSLRFLSQHPGIPVFSSLGFGLNNSNSPLTLYNNAGKVILNLHYTDSIPWQIAADGYGRTLELKTDTANPAISSNWFAGCMGGSPGGPYTQCPEKIIFSEINYFSSSTLNSGEWVELHNIGTIPQDISLWKFRDKNDFHKYDIPSGTIMNPGDYLVLCNDTTNFSNYFPLTLNKKGLFNFGLSNQGDVIRLYNAMNKLYLSVAYDEDNPWPQGANGNSYTLELLDSLKNYCDALNWFDGCPGGSPGYAFVQPCNLGVHEILNENEIRIFPNPATEKLFVEFQEHNPMNCQVTVSNVMGKQILVQLISKPLTALDISKLSPGIYIIKITSLNGQIVSRFVKE